MTASGKPTTRRDLLYLLAQASELEHSLACQYLFTAFSLKERTNEGVTDGQLRKINGWRRQIIKIAVQEMLHLALASAVFPPRELPTGQDPHISEPELHAVPIRRRHPAALHLF